MTISNWAPDDSATQKFYDALSAAITASPLVSRKQDSVKCSLVVLIPAHVNAEVHEGRAMISYRVNAFLRGGPSLGSYTGGCWLDEVVKCGTTAARQVLTAIQQR